MSTFSGGLSNYVHPVYWVYIRVIYWGYVGVRLGFHWDNGK